MTGINCSTENVFSIDVGNINNVSEAARIGNAIFNATYEKTYLNERSETLIAFLETASKMQNDKGFIPLFVDDTMPLDARVELIYQPTYAIATIALYCYEEYNSDFNEQLKAFLEKLLNVFNYGIITHGFDVEETMRKTMDMLSIKSVKRFIEENANLSKALNNTIKSIVGEYKVLLTKGVKISESFDPDTIHNTEWLRIVSFWEGKSNAVFVYGTLRRNEQANDMLADSIYCGKFVLKNCAMYNLGIFPGIVENSGETVVGEVYFVDEKTIQKLDIYEGEGSLYKRKLVNVHNGQETMECFAYFYLKDIDNRTQMKQPWGNADNDEVYYAAYGSNLSEERFACYIMGGICKKNGRRYNGCSNKTKWKSSELKVFKGRLYFGNNSSSWGNGGVTFYDENGKSFVQMKLYKITRGQLLDIQAQEGASASWYGRLLCLGIHEDGSEIYTMTSKTIRPANAPSVEYLDLIETALVNDCGYTKNRAKKYIASIVRGAVNV